MRHGHGQTALFLAGLLLFVAIGVHFLNYAPDDIYITLRYAKNLAEGRGPVYNVGEKVEGFSNPIFLAWLAVLQPTLRTPVKMAVAAKTIGLAAGLLTLLFLAGAARRDPEGAAAWGWTPLLFGLSGYAALWAASGMETGLHLLVLAAAIGAYIRALETGRRAWRLLCGPLFGALALSRPEGIAFLGAVLAARGALLWRDGKRPDFADAGFLVLALAPPLTYAAWRHGAYGVWLPNTFYAKAGAGLSTWADGLRYLLEALGPTLWGNALLLPLVFVGLAPWRKATPRTAVLLAALAAQVCFVVAGGGDWMPGWRFAVPAAPLLALLAPSVVVRVTDAANHKRLAEWTGGWRRYLVLALAALPVAAHLYAVKQAHPSPSGWSGLRTAEMFAPDYKTIADWLTARARPGDWLATGEAGLIPYLTGLPTIDCFGLTDAHLARRPGKRHEKIDPDYILERRPRFIVIGGTRVSGDRLTSDFAYGRSLLEHPRVEAEFAFAFRLHSFAVLRRAEDVAP